MIVRKQRRNVEASKRDIKASKTYIAAADDFDDLADMADSGEGDITDAIGDVADNIEDLQDTIDDVEEDEPTIEVLNNIGDHFIAECGNCGGIFISAVVDSDQDIKYVTGDCPLCGKESDQYLKWIIRDVAEEE